MHDISNDMVVEKLYGNVSKSNIASQMVLIKAGFIVHSEKKRKNKDNDIYFQM